MFHQLMGILGFGLLVSVLLDPALHRSDFVSQPDVDGPNIESFIKDLGADDFPTREVAFGRLRAMPNSLRYLRRHELDADPEKRKRIAVLIDELVGNRYRKLFREATKDRADAPIDLVMDLMLENQEHVSADEWQTVYEISAALEKKLLNREPIAARSERDSLLNPFLRGDSLSVNRLSCQRIIGPRVEAKQSIGSSALIVSGSVGAPVWGRSIVLMRGNPGILDKETAKRTLIGLCFVYCDHDIVCKTIATSVVIARGRILAAEIDDDAIVVASARGSKTVRLFRAGDLGFDFEASGKGVRVRGIRENSVAARTGLKTGDSIVTDGSEQDPISALERSLRRSFAAQSNLPMQVRRNGETISVVLRFGD
jgi:hypothetical protein